MILGASHNNFIGMNIYICVCVWFDTNVKKTTIRRKLKQKGEHFQLIEDLFKILNLNVYKMLCSVTLDVSVSDVYGRKIISVV